MTGQDESDEIVDALRQQLGEALRRLRLKQDSKVTLTALAKEMGGSHSHLSRVETGADAPSREIVVWYERRFNAPSGSLVRLWDELDQARENQKAKTRARHRGAGMEDALSSSGPSQADDAEAEPAQNAEPTPSRTLRQRRWLPMVLGTGVLAVVVVGIVIAVWSINNGDGSPGPTADDGRSPSLSATTTPLAEPQSGKTYPEQQGSFGAPTYADPFRPATTGVKVKPFQWVEVSCKVQAPTIPSASPDGYWYRLASPPWKNEWYAIANTFWNGDRPGGPTEHNTDFAVPDCKDS